MTIDIPVSWFAYDDLPATGKWDQMWVRRLLSMTDARPPGAYRFIDAPFDPDDGIGRVLVMPVGSYGGNAPSVARRLLADLNKLPWCLLIATSDECSKFPWEMMGDWPEHVIPWIMTPEPGRYYPSNARFIGEGSPIPPSEFAHSAALTRDLDMYYSGQQRSDHRQRAVEAMRTVPGRTKITPTPRFLTDPKGHQVSEPGADHEYVFSLTRSWIAPAPNGTCTPDSFRLYEALEAGCVPIVFDNGYYWRMIDLDSVVWKIGDWADLPLAAAALLQNRCKEAADVSSQWQQHKRRVQHQINDDVQQLAGIRLYDEPQDQITVLIVTSPVPSNPSLDMIQKLIESVRVDLPGAEILIGCDSPHESLPPERVDTYNHFLHRLCCWANAQFNITVFTTDRHSHESGLLHMLMPEVRTPLVLFMEHDCPLIQPVDFAACLTEMGSHDLRHLRFGHEAHVLDEHAYLYPFGTEPEGAKGFINRHIKTVQYSSRPALYTSELMRELLDTYFAPEATCMIESVLYGPFQTSISRAHAESAENRAFADRLRRQEAWGRYRSALWAPGTNLAFSGHLDGRGDDPNVPLSVIYPNGDVPIGAPQPGEMLI